MKQEDYIKSYHIDRTIVLFFLFTIVVTATVFAFRYLNYVPCELVDFEIDAEEYKVDEIFKFKDNTVGVTERIWDFGDTTATDDRVAPFHTYHHPGQYTVQLMVNGRCEGSQLITVREKEFVVDSTKLARFEIPSTIEVEEVLKVFDNTPNSETWEWKFGETSEVNSIGRDAEYIYSSEGWKTITLVVNGDIRHGTSKKILVTAATAPSTRPATPRTRTSPIPRRPRTRHVGETIPQRPRGISPPLVPPTTISPPPPPPPPPPPEVVATPSISRENFARKLMAVSKGKEKASDFNTYLCDNENVTTKMNGRTKTFKDLCDKIKNKGILIQALELQKGENNCINHIKIRFSRTSLFN